MLNRDSERLSLLSLTPTEFLLNSDLKLLNNEGLVFISVNAFTMYLFSKNEIPLNIQNVYVLDSRVISYLLFFVPSLRDKSLIRGSDFGIELVEHSSIARNLLIIGGNQSEAELIESKFEDCFHKVVVHSIQIENPKDESILSELTQIICKLNIDTIFVCIGQPKQEIVASQITIIFPNIQIFCLGAFLDFYIGSQKRAPKFISKLGFEWAWRLISNPKRLGKRYLKYSPIGLFWFILHFKLFI